MLGGGYIAGISFAILIVIVQGIVLTICVICAIVSWRKPLVVKVEEIEMKKKLKEDKERLKK